MRKKMLISVSASVAAVVIGCGGGSGLDSISPHFLTTISVPGISSAVAYSFDLGAVDIAANRYYVTDRTNKSVDVVDTNSYTVLSQYQNGYKGCVTGSGVAAPACLAVGGSGVNNDKSGPDGLDVVGANLYVGDVNSLKIVDQSSGKPVKTLSIGGASGLRADEGCVDAEHGLYAISSPGESPPFMTVVDTVNQNILATVYFDSAGLEACTYDPTTKMFFVNNDGSSSNGRGEISGYPAAFFSALKTGAGAAGPNVQFLFSAWGTPGANASGVPAPTGTVLAGTVSYALGNCDPTGLALGPGKDIGAMCRQGNVGETLTFLILDRTNGSLLKTVAAGGGDQITYDAGSNKWYLADSRWTATGTSCGGGSAACPLTPVLGIVDGTSRSLIAMLPNGNNAHSVAIVPGTSKTYTTVFTPFTAPTAAGGGAAFPAGGINIYLSQ